MKYRVREVRTIRKDFINDCVISLTFLFKKIMEKESVLKSEKRI